MKNIKYILKKNILVLIMIIVLCPVLSFSYSKFVLSTSEYRASEMYIGKLLYSISINETSVSDYVIPPGETELVIKVTSLNSVSSNYRLVYEKNDNISAVYATDENEETYGLITTTKTSTVLITNKSGSDITVSFDILGGYKNNQISDIVIPSNYLAIEQGIFKYDFEMLDIYIDGVLSEEIDNEGYILDNYSCTNGETVTYDDYDQSITIESYSDSTKCTLYFESIVYTSESCFAFEDGIITKYYDYENNDNTNSACPRDVVVPKKIGGEMVTSIGEMAFSQSGLTSAVLPSSITSIGDRAFSWNFLTLVTLPTSLINIGGEAFNYNNLTSLTIPSSVTTIGDSAFSGNNLTSLTIPSSVTTIESNAFSWNKLTSLTIPSSVTSIGGAAFNNNELPQAEAYIYNRTDTNNDGVAEIDYTTIISYGGESSDVDIPMTKNDVDLSIIGPYAFYNESLTNAIIPNSVTIIGRNAFANNELASITIPDSVERIAEYAFIDNSLTSVTISGKISSEEFIYYGSDNPLFNEWGVNIWGWDSSVTCVTDNTSNVENGCIYWAGSDTVM